MLIPYTFYSQDSSAGARGRTIARQLVLSWAAASTP